MAELLILLLSLARFRQPPALRMPTPPCRYSALATLLSPGFRRCCIFSFAIYAYTALRYAAFTMLPGDSLHFSSTSFDAMFTLILPLSIYFSSPLIFHSRHYG